MYHLITVEGRSRPEAYRMKRSYAVEGCSADQAARRWLEDNESKIAVGAAQAGSALNDAEDRAGQRPTEPAKRGAHTNKWAVLGLVVVGTFMTNLDASIVNISLPSIARTFNTPLGGTVEWVIIAYLVVIAATLLTFGRVSDLIGRKPVWVAGLVLFTLGSALCGAASSLSWLVAARIFQGLGGALLFAPSMAIITDAFPAAERGLALGLTTVVAALGVSAGPTLGGLITEHMSWRWIFYLNVPLGALALLVTWRVLGNAGRRTPQPFDPAGAGLLAVGFAAMALGLSFGQAWGWTSARLLSCLAASVLALIAAAVVERRVRHPIIDLTLLHNRVFTSALLSMTLAMLALFAVSFLLPFYFEALRGFSVATSGVLLTPLPLTIAVIAPVSGWLADRMGSRGLAVGGLAIACLGLLLLAGLDAQSSTWDIIWRLAITGLGQGLFQSPNARALMNAAPRDEQGESSSLLATARVVGQSLSVALAGSIFASLGGATAARTLVAPAQQGMLVAGELRALQLTFLSSFRAALLACAVFAAIGIGTALVRGHERSPAARIKHEDAS
jgi:EmrB/QacA subfamily drug resistance transporter